jgi:arsenite-transporting ATPase
MTPLPLPRFLVDPPRFLFFTGKGGVGKTSIACATAVRLAEAGRRVLLVSTDPASNVGQVFGQAIGNHIVPIAGMPGLDALEIDPQDAAAGYRRRIVDPVRGKLPDDVVRGIEEQLSGACTTEIAAFDEFTGLLTDDALVARYDHVLFDTAPTGHTIRLLQLPGAWSGFLEAGAGDASCLGPLAGLDKQRDRYRDAVAALSDPARTRLVLVSRAHTSALKEAARTHDELALVGLKRQHLVINGLMPEREAAADPLAAAVFRREQAALRDMPASIAALPTDDLPLHGFDLVGVPALRRLFIDEPAEPLDAADAVPAAAAPSIEVPTLASLADQIAATGHGLVMVMGKGGVGKTTIAAALAVDLARRGLPVHLTTSDPAAHLVDTLGGALPHLTVSRIDPAAETTRYREQVMAAKGRALDDAGRALLAEDLRSPCTEEIAVFQAFSRIVREAGTRFVVMDTAPTGHTLLLLDATGAYHREIARQMGGKGLHFTTPMMMLQDPERTKVLVVTLAETTPILEAEQLQADLGRAGIVPWAWVVNDSIATAGSRSPLLRHRAANERRRIAEVAARHAQRLAVVSLQAEEPIGVQRLEALVRPEAVAAPA